ncbi:MAG TPA: hypothetical protein VF544_08200 [Pyrinomonadaceae bacterium]
MVGLVALAIVMHGVVLYGGQLAVEAKAYLYLKIRTRRLNKEIKRLDNKYYKAITAATRAYILHEHLVQEYRWLFPNAEMSTGPFDITTRRLLQAKLGRELPGLPQSPHSHAHEEHSNIPSTF